MPEAGRAPFAGSINLATGLCVAAMFAAAIGAQEDDVAEEPSPRTSVDELREEIDALREEVDRAREEARRRPGRDPLAVTSAPDYRTPRSGEALDTTILGEPVHVPARDRRDFAAWDLGAAVISPNADESEVLPFASLYFWRHEENESLLRAVVAGVYNEALYTRTRPEWDGLEGVLTLTTFTVPVELGELVDGNRLESEELFWGYVRPGIGAGYRREVEPGYNDNFFLAHLTVEPGFLYFAEGDDAADSFQLPQDTLETRGHLQLRWDALERNLLELPHLGFAAGADGIVGRRHAWSDWGTNAQEQESSGKEFALFTGYLVGAAGVPLVDDERHRMLASLHGGVGKNVDRFSAPRVGGGPVGEEVLSLARPVLPGAVIEEFHPDHYAVLVAEYRWEPIFFTYLSARAAAAYLNRDVFEDGRQIERRDDFLGAVGGRITTGFLFSTRLQIDYNYNFDVVRRNKLGGHEIVVHLSGEF